MSTHLLETISIDSCRHYRGWRYGCYGNNLYEDYIIGLFKGLPREDLRRTFLQRVLGSRGDNMGDLLGIGLTQNYPPWVYPWDTRSVLSIYRPYAAADNPDIVCHSSNDGVLASHINREFLWCERALDSISRLGYQPKKHGYVAVLRLVNNNGVFSHIVVDGNHRLSALSAINVNKVEALILDRIRLGYLMLWPGVLLGRFKCKDAASIFNRYFVPTNPIVKELYREDMLILDEPLKIFAQPSTA